MKSTTTVLFLCTGNSCRSILAEATFNHLAPPGWRAMSAGSKPTGKVHPRSLALLTREGISTEGYDSKSWDDLPEVPDIVVTVCASAAGETCPVHLGPVLRTHWGVDDPAHATGADAEIDAAFMRAYRTLRARIEAFLALPLPEIRLDRARLKAELDQIGEHASGTWFAAAVNNSRSPIVKNVQVFDPAMCCSSGVCGAEVDQALMEFAADVDWLKKQGVTVERFNLAQQPQAFASSATIRDLLHAQGEAALPVILVDDEVKHRGAPYPSRDQLAQWAGIAPAKSSCCGPADTSSPSTGTKCC